MSRARGPLRFGKDARIRKRREFQLIQRVGQRVKLRYSVLVLRAHAEERLSARLGITASRKVGPAVVRNRAKRLIREAFRTNIGLFPSDIEVVVIVQAAPPELRLQDVAGEWQRAEPLIRARIQDARRARDRALVS